MRKMYFLMRFVAWIHVFIEGIQNASRRATELRAQKKESRSKQPHFTSSSSIRVVKNPFAQGAETAPAYFFHQILDRLRSIFAICH